MTWNDFVKAVFQLLGTLWSWAVFIARRHTLGLVASALVVLALMSAWRWYDDWRTTEFVILVGPGGGPSAREAKSIRKSIVNQSSPLGFAYRARIESTEGFEEIRQLVSEDQTGKVIGFAHDGFGSAENVRILLPLDNNYLHIFCRKGFLTNDLNLNAGNKITFANLLEHKDKLRRGRLFPGPQDSGTRQLAELVLKRYGLDVYEYQASGIADWYDMRAALNNKQIDLAFYSGPLNTDIVKGIAADQSAVMVGLDGDRDAIRQGRVFVLPEQFAASSYVNGDFCPEPLQTIASRRVLICSPHMSDATAYFLARQSHSAMRSAIPEIDWVNPPPDEPGSTGLTYQLHPGAERVKSQNPPGLLPWNWNYVLLTFALWMGTELATSVNRRLRKPTAEPEPTMPSKNVPTSLPLKAELLTTAPAVGVLEAPSRTAYEALEDEIHGPIFEDFLALPAVLSKEQRAAWKKRVDGLRERIKSAGSGLTSTDAEALLTATNKLANALKRRREARKS